MKKKNIVSALFLSAMSLIFSVNYIPRLPSISVPRSDALGGLYVTDKFSPYSMLSNVAITPDIGAAKILPNLTFRLAGQITDLLQATADYENNSNFFDSIMALIQRTNGAYASVDVTLPLTFGGIHPFTWGTLSWGIFNRMYGNVLIPSTTSSNIYGGIELLPQVGYSYAVINNESHILSFGINVKFLLQLEGFFQGVPTDIMSYYLETPLYASAGVGFDVGIYYYLKNIFTVGLSCKNIVFPVWTAGYTVRSFLGDPFVIQEVYLNYLPMNLTFGLAVDLPKGWTKGLLSRWRIMLDYENIVFQATDGSRQILTPFSYTSDLRVRHPMLNLHAGMEFELYNVIAVRVGLRDMYLAAGLGFNLKPIVFDISFFGTELTNELGGIPQFNLSMAFSLNL